MRQSEVNKLKEYYSKDPKWVEAQIEIWLKQDGCFSNLQLFTASCLERNLPKKQALQQLLEKHEKACGGMCLRNVLIQEHRTPDSLRKLVYKDVLERFMLLWTKLQGVRSTRKLKPEGLYFRSTFSAKCVTEQSLPFTAMEMFQPTDEHQKSRIVLDVCSEALFKDPRPLIQHLDFKTCQEIKDFPAYTQLLHWRAIIGENEPELAIRWDGKTKIVAPDWTLFGRYEELMRKYSSPSTLIDIDKEGVIRRDNERSEEILRLREIALAYDGNSYFMGNLKKTLEFRNIDKFRKAIRDPLFLANSPRGDLQSSDSEGNENTAQKPWDSEISPLVEPLKDPIVEVNERLDHRKWLSLLQKSLGPEERLILKLHLWDMSDSKIAENLKCRRETVNRKLARIRRIAQQIKA